MMLERTLLAACRQSPLLLKQISKRAFRNNTFSLVLSVTVRNQSAHCSHCKFVSITKPIYSSSSRWMHLTRSLSGKIIEVEGPAFAESITEGDIKWIKGKGDQINADDVVAEIETDKTTVEVPAPQSGTIVELLVEDGSKVVAHQKLYKLELGPGAAAAEPAQESKPASEEVRESVKEVAAEASPSPPLPSPPPKPAAQQPAAPVAPKQAPVPSPIMSPVSVPTMSSTRNETRVKMNRMRLRIAQRLKDAQNTYAMLTTFNEVDMSNLMQMRSRYQKEFLAKHGAKLGMMSPFVRAAAYGLHEFPSVNAVIDDNEIVYRHYTDISVAVATPKGLVVPVIRNVESMDYATIEKILNELGLKAREGKLAVEDMEGGTFTISNGGVFGSVFGTPIINPPQSAILGMHGIFDRPWVVDGKVEIRPIMTIALTYDHRVIDGREAVSFLKLVKNVVEDPRRILMNL